MRYFHSWASSCSINHFLGRFRAFDWSSNHDVFLKALAGKKFVNPAEGLLLIKAAESILDDLQIVSNGHQLSKLPKGKRQKPQNVQFPSAMSQRKLKDKMLWATGETCKTQKHHWRGSDWPSEASLGDFAHPFLVPPLPVDASSVEEMWEGCGDVWWVWWVSHSCLKNHSRLICSEASFQFSAAQLASASLSAGTAPLAGIVHSAKAQTPSKQTAETSEPHVQNTFCRHPLPQPPLWSLYLSHILLVA